MRYTLSGQMASGNSDGSSSDNHERQPSVLFKEELQSFTQITKDGPGLSIKECHVIVQRLEDENHTVVVEKHNIKVL